MSAAKSTVETWRVSRTAWLVAAVAAALTGFIFRDGIVYLMQQWELPEYNYGYLIPLIAVFFVWQRRDLLRRSRFQGSWLGTVAVSLGLIACVVGSMGAVFTIVHYAMVLVIAGLTLAYLGFAGARAIWMALLVLLFMIPLPGFLYQSLSNELQLLSSRIGVGFIRLFGISVFLEGNVIDLGAMKLQVVEACSGLRYLFPLVTIGFIACCFYIAPFWKRALVFLSTIPITILMNSLRIGVIGVLVEYQGREMAEGFLHDFEGWIVFMLSTLVLVGEMALLAKIGGNRRLLDTFRIDLPVSEPTQDIVRRRALPAPLLAATALLALATALSFALPKHVDVIPARAGFAEFPLTLGTWQGQRERMAQIYLDSLNLDDYLLADYVDGEKRPVNLYVGYYATQNPDKVPHSPRACIPAGGWEISGFARRTFADVLPGAVPLNVNRAIIERGRQRHLVLYWFKQRERNVADEYRVKWFIFWDALTRSRSDGALVRLVTPLADGEDADVAERRLGLFLRQMTPVLGRFVPD